MKSWKHDENIISLKHRNNRGVHLQKWELSAYGMISSH